MSNYSALYIININFTLRIESQFQFQFLYLQEPSSISLMQNLKD